jgi:hypothetical protein
LLICESSSDVLTNVTDGTVDLAGGTTSASGDSTGTSVDVTGDISDQIGGSNGGEEGEGEKLELHIEVYVDEKTEKMN